MKKVKVNNAKGKWFDMDQVKVLSHEGKNRGPYVLVTHKGSFIYEYTNTSKHGPGLGTTKYKLIDAREVARHVIEGLVPEKACLQYPSVKEELQNLKKELAKDEV